MTRTIPRSPVENWEQPLDTWLADIERLALDVEQWSAANEWAVKRETEQVIEDKIGAYEVPVLTIQASRGRAYFNPVAR